MTFFYPTLVLLLSAITINSIQGCSEPGYYAPVTVHNSQVSVKARSEIRPLILENHQILNNTSNLTSNRQEIGKSNQTSYSSRNDKDLPSLRENNTFLDRKMMQAKDLPPTYKMPIKQRYKTIAPDIGSEKSELTKGLDQSFSVDANKDLKSILIGKKDIELQQPYANRNSKTQMAYFKAANKQEKKSIISIDKKKMLKLKFEWPIHGRIARNYYQSNNKGIDIAGKIGQKVRASEAGKIVFSGHGLVGLGNLVIIEHNNLFLSAYGNNSRLLVAEGDQVEKGQVIAKLGKALSKKAALHFEIRKNGKPLNPLKLLPKK